MKKAFLALPLALAVSSLSWAKTDLTVYTALENEQLKEYKQAFEAKNQHPSIISKSTTL